MIIPPPPKGLDGNGWGVRLQRYYEPREWPQRLQDVPAEHRAQAEAYLRDIAARMRIQRRKR